MGWIKDIELEYKADYDEIVDKQTDPMNLFEYENYAIVKTTLS